LEAFSISSFINPKVFNKKVEKADAVIGGFQLTEAKPELIQRTVADIKAIGPDYIVPTYRTGFEAITAFSNEMPDEFILNTVGIRNIFAA
jgi:metal-dependent hydrolase (beta-lactamase superfamily II)